MIKRNRLSTDNARLNGAPNVAVTNTLMNDCLGDIANKSLQENAVNLCLTKSSTPEWDSSCLSAIAGKTYTADVLQKCGSLSDPSFFGGCMEQFGKPGAGTP